jgi:hypothetical protein
VVRLPHPPLGEPRAPHRALLVGCRRLGIEGGKCFCEVYPVVKTRMERGGR